MIQDEMYHKIIDVTEKIAKTEGTSDINVRRILKELDITNRVFYNRFANIDSVMEIIYERSILIMRDKIHIALYSGKDFFDAVIDAVANALTTSYESRMNLNQYVFNNDSHSQKNYEWWKNEIEKIINKGKELGFILMELDTETMSYSVWCFIRGYIADAVSRGLPIDEALKSFKYSFSVFLRGMAVMK